MHQVVFTLHETPCFPTRMPRTKDHQRPCIFLSPVRSLVKQPGRSLSPPSSTLGLGVGIYSVEESQSTERIAPRGRKNSDRIYGPFLPATRSVTLTSPRIAGNLHTVSRLKALIAVCVSFLHRSRGIAATVRCAAALPPMFKPLPGGGFSPPPHFLTRRVGYAFRSPSP